MIKVQGLGKRYDGRMVVRDLAFDAPNGAITGLLGSNGAGKTTTLRMKPRHEIMQTLVDVVDVESGDLQWPSLSRKDHSGLTRVSLCKYFVG